MAMTKNLQIDAGAIADPLRKQIEQQGLSVPAGTLDHCQRDMDAISRCCVRGLISDSAAHSARKRVVKKLAAAAVAKN